MPTAHDPTPTPRPDELPDRSRLDPAVYRELRRIASALMRGERAQHTLSATALVNEAWMRLDGFEAPSNIDRADLVRRAATAMRRVLVDHARRHHRERRGAGWRRVTMSALNDAPARESAEIVALDEALRRLSEVDSRLAQVVELRYFGGLSIEETADALHCSPRTVKRDWTLARAWLYQSMNE